MKFLSLFGRTNSSSHLTLDGDAAPPLAPKRTSSPGTLPAIEKVGKPTTVAAIPSPLTDVETLPIGESGTATFRIVYVDSDGYGVTPLNRIPLYVYGKTAQAQAPAGSPGSGNALLSAPALNLICSTPRGSRVQMELAEDEIWSPLRLRLRNGKPWPFQQPMEWNYGVLSQTWAGEDSRCDSEAVLPPDERPLEAVEIGSKLRTCGEVYAVKPLGCFAVIEPGTLRLSWKMVAIAVDDPIAPDVNHVADLQEKVDGTLEEIREWLRCCHCNNPGDPEFVFGLNEFAADLTKTWEVIARAHKCWAKSVVLDEPRLLVGDSPYAPWTWAEAHDLRRTVSSTVGEGWTSPSPRPGLTPLDLTSRYSAQHSPHSHPGQQGFAHGPTSPPSKRKGSHWPMPLPSPLPSTVPSSSSFGWPTDVPSPGAFTSVAQGGWPQPIPSPLPATANGGGKWPTYDASPVESPGAEQLLRRGGQMSLLQETTREQMWSKEGEREQEDGGDEEGNATVAENASRNKDRLSQISLSENAQSGNGSHRQSGNEERMRMRSKWPDGPSVDAGFPDGPSEPGNGLQRPSGSEERAKLRNRWPEGPSIDEGFVGLPEQSEDGSSRPIEREEHGRLRSRWPGGLSMDDGFPDIPEEAHSPDERTGDFENANGESLGEERQNRYRLNDEAESSFGRSIEGGGGGSSSGELDMEGGSSSSEALMYEMRCSLSPLPSGVAGAQWPVGPQSGKERISMLTRRYSWDVADYVKSEEEERAIRAAGSITRRESVAADVMRAAIPSGTSPMYLT
eukprot:TRINITY_DN29825_c0_g1_i1.p1 TRINITY_DN29825_c0_g1~~TRINITY_DN29825_c0_g1_i1.p1  ORF type:complete len:787 (+),score=109.38 TRINITY_DN29825_c0_g1_i1:386-2746(+)